MSDLLIWEYDCAGVVLTNPVESGRVGCWFTSQKLNHCFETCRIELAGDDR